MPIPSSSEVSSDERIIAALAHGTALLFGWGIVVAAILWAAQRRKSAFVAFHALQALGYQLCQTIFWVVWACGLGVLLFGATIGLGAAIPESSSDIGVIIAVLPQMLFMLGFMFGFVVYLLPAIIGAAMILARRDFYYPLLGHWMRKYLEADAAQAEDAL